MNSENPNPEHSIPDQTPETPQQQVVEAAAKLAALAINSSHDSEERSALVDTLKAGLGETGIVIHDLEEPADDQRRGPKGYTRDEIILMRQARFGRRVIRQKRIGWRA